MIETHPWLPFIPPKAKMLFLGSFPPPEKRHSMPFFYPNLQNDFWRVMGLIFYDSPDVFLVPGEKRFDQRKIESFLTRQRIAMYDVGQRVERLDGNASDNRLRIVEPVDLSALLNQIPTCKIVVATGQKALDEILRQAGASAAPAIGESIQISFNARLLTLFRMPSTSRAYPKPLTYKADMYRRCFESEK
ncbi:MAG: uracil-DNA glycosylase family protein [Thermoguttaceae bacterium]|nr:uracil-DNA glycosylase family protein [Thermoguttaceae bacterium]